MELIVMLSNFKQIIKLKVDMRSNKRLVILVLVLIGIDCYDWSGVDNIMSQGIAQRAFPGGVVMVANMTNVIFSKNYGTFTYQHDLYEIPVTNSTKYDVASITKMMGTTFGIMNLYSSNQIKLTDLVSKYITNFDTNKKGNTTIANLLLHNSGLPTDLTGPTPSSKSDIIDQITFIKPLFPTASQFHYSNLGFIMLGQIIERVTKKNLSQYLSQNRQFAGLKDTGFNPPASDFNRIPPTEYDSQIRKHIVRGQAHQRLSYIMNGVSGHSGYFTTAPDLLRYMQILLNKGKLPNELRTISQEVVNLFTTRVGNQTYQNLRGYGFDTNCPGTLIKDCFGHDGSTGISAWADKQKKILFVIMTNRGHPDVKNNLYFDKYKALLSDAIVKGSQII